MADHSAEIDIFPMPGFPPGSPLPKGLPRSPKGPHRPCVLGVEPLVLGAPTSGDTAEPFCPGVCLERALVLNNVFPQMRTSIRWRRQPAPPPGSGQDDTSVLARSSGCLSEPCSFPSPQGPFVREQLSQPDRPIPLPSSLNILWA